MEPEIVFENENYTVVTGLMFGGDGAFTYKIVNKKYDILEAETTILPRAIESAREYNTYLNRLSADMIAEEDELQFDLPDPKIN